MSGIEVSGTRMKGFPGRSAPRTRADTPKIRKQKLNLLNDIGAGGSRYVAIPQRRTSLLSVTTFRDSPLLEVIKIFPSGSNCHHWTLAGAIKVPCQPNSSC